MTNPNDLIIKAKEDIKTLENLFETWNGEYKCWFNDGIAFQVLKDKLSQIESVNVWIPVVPSDIWSNEYAYVMVTDWVKIWPAYYDTHQWFFWHDNDLPVDPTLVKLDSFKHNLPPPNKV